MNPTFKKSLCALLGVGLVAAIMSGCGGGGGSSGSNSSSGGTGGSSGGTTTPVVNTAPLIADGGPSGVNGINLLYVTVTLCAPGSTTQCQTIDHVQVDTGSTGFRVIASVLGSGLTSAQLPAVTNSSGSAVVECTQFADGFSWGPVKTADLTIAGESAKGVTVQVIGDPTYESAIPEACRSPVNQEEDTVTAFGANAILGVGNFVQDCGEYCAQANQTGANYNVCTGTDSMSCSPYSIPVSSQVSNPVASFATDNNGVLVSLPSIPANGATNPAGSLIFGINTQSDNQLGSATVLQLTDSGTFTATLADSYETGTLTESFIDSGSNAYFFPSNITLCSDGYFYCPSSTLSLSAQAQGSNGATRTVDFSIADANNLTQGITASSSLGGPAVVSSSTFDFGLPFFFGHPVFIALESTTLAGVAGPTVAF